MSSLSGLEECHFNANGNSVWAFLLEAEQDALTQATPDQFQYESALIAIRVVGFLFHDLWNKARRWNLGDTAHSQMIKQINSIRRYGKEVWFDKLVELGLMYRNRLLCVYRSAAIEPDFLPSDDTPSSSLDALMEQIMQGMKDKPHNDYNIKRQALLRDGFKCALTGLYDYDVWEQLRPNERGENRLSDTKAVYLFPESTQTVPKESSASVFALLSMFGLEPHAESLCNDGVHFLQNVITLEASFDKLFEKFYLWLEPVAGQEHTYDVCGPVTDNRVNWIPGPLPARIALRVDPLAEAKAAEQKLTLCLPDPSLVAVRAICARVSMRSGAAKQRDQFLKDLAESTVLAQDGSMASLLAARLSIIYG